MAGETLQQALTQAQSTLFSAPGGPSFVTSEPSVDALTIYRQKREREAKADAGTYMGAVWRQDSPVDGIVAGIVGSQFAPDPSYAPFEPAEWSGLTKDIQPEYHRFFYQATSPAHAMFIRERLLQKQDDLANLGDMGPLGVTGRLAFGFIEPSTALMGVGAGGIARAAGALGRASRGLQKATTAQAVESAMGDIAGAARARSGAAGYVAGLGAALAGNAAFEAVRQRVNFEDDSASIIESAILGTLFAAPFVHLNAREMGRLAQTAEGDHRTLQVLRKVNEGQPLTETDVDWVKKWNDAVEHVRKAETGDLDPAVINRKVFYVDSAGRASKGEMPADADARLSITEGPDGTANITTKPIFVDSQGTATRTLPERAWLDDFRAQLRNELQQTLAEVKARMGGPTEGPTSSRKLSPEELAKLEARVKREDEAFEARKRGAGEPSTKVRLKDLDQGTAPKNTMLADLLAPLRDQMARAKAAQARSKELGDEFDAALAQLEARKEKELDDLWAQGHLSQADAEAAKTEAKREAKRARDAAYRARKKAEREGADMGDLLELALRGEDGRPLVVYHGTPHRFERFDLKKFGSTTDAGFYGRGVYFTNQREVAEGYAKKGANGEVRQHSLVMRKPYVTREQVLSDEELTRIKAEGYDGVISKAAEEQGYIEYVVFDTNQILPAIETPKSPDGTEVFWVNSEGRPESGIVVERLPNGRYKVDTWPELAQGIQRTPDGTPRYKAMRPDQFDPDSPLFEADPAPEGFGPGNVGAAQVGGTTIAPAGDYPDASPDYANQTAMAKMRIDLFARLNKSDNLVVRELAHILVRDAIGNSPDWAQRWTASERKRHYVRVLAGHAHSEAREAWNEVRKIRNLNLFNSTQQHQDFFEAISRIIRGDTQILADNPDIAPQLTRAANAMRKAYTDMADILKKSGVEGSEFIEPNAAYVNRVWNHGKIRSAIATHGEDQVLKMLAEAIDQRVVENFKKSPRFHQLADKTDEGIRAAKAASFLKTVRSLEYSPAMQDVLLAGRDMATLRRSLDAAGVPDSQIDDIVDMMFEAKASSQDAGAPTNLRFRFNLNENHSIKTKAGDLHMTDLFENDVRLLLDMYMNSMAGHAALAERGIKSRADFQKRLREAVEWHGEHQSATKDAGAFKDELRMLEDIYAHTTGKPMSMQQFNKIDRFISAFRAYTRSVFLGQLGVAAAFELKNAIGLAGFRAFMDQAPTFRGFIQAFRSGKVANTELRQAIEAMTGFGQERAAAYARQYEVTDFTYDRGLTQFENWSNKASHVIDIISGNSHMTSATRQYSAILMVQKHSNWARGRKMSEKEVERLVHQGIDRRDIEEVFEDLKHYSKVGSRGEVLEIDWEAWQKERSGTYETYSLALTREVRDAVQEQDLGELPMWVHGPIAKLFTELRTFNIAAHAKQFAKGLHYMDTTTAVTWSLSFVGECLAYALQTSINFAHNPDELERRLSEGRIVAAALQRMSVLGVSAMLFETGYFVASGGNSLVQAGATTNTDNRNAFLTPSMMAANRLIKGASVAVGAVNPFTNQITTRQDMKDLLGVLPGGNTYLMRNLNDYLSSQFPKREVVQQ